LKAINFLYAKVQSGQYTLLDTKLNEYAPVAVSNLPIKPGSFARGAVENPINAAAGVDWMTESRQGGEGSDRPDERE
jgi:hypothetical protein